MFKFYFSGLKKPVKPVKLPGQAVHYVYSLIREKLSLAGR